MKRKLKLDAKVIGVKQDSENNTYSGTEDLKSSENSLVSYNKYIVRQFIRFSGFNHLSNIEKSNKKVLDFGAGVGSLAILWCEMSEMPVDCFEVDPRQLQIIRRRGLTGIGSFTDITQKYDFVYSSNVLEHIDNDREILSNLAEKIKSNGRIAIYVPAFNILFSDLDKSVGHFRRYSKRELKKKVEQSGFKVVRCRYVDSIGFFASLFIKVLGWKGIGNIGGQKSLVFYDRFIFPISQFLDFLSLGKVLGKNLFLVAEKS
jgi:SAM-dependent methyltransferase